MDENVASIRLGLFSLLIKFCFHDFQGNLAYHFRLASEIMKVELSTIENANDEML